MDVSKIMDIITANVEEYAKENRATFVKKFVKIMNDNGWQWANFNNKFKLQNLNRKWAAKRYNSYFGHALASIEHELINNSGHKEVSSYCNSGMMRCQIIYNIHTGKTRVTMDMCLE
jgi:hypothetical protein